MKRPNTKQTKPEAPKAKDQPNLAPESSFWISHRLTTNLQPWLKITSAKTGMVCFLPFPIRLIQQVPDEKGGGCLVRGAHGDEVLTKENAVEVLGKLNAYTVGGDVTCWALASPGKETK